MTKEKTMAMQIQERVREGRAPPCAHCATAGTLAGGHIGYVQCRSCGAKYKSLKEAWKQALKRAIEENGKKWWR